MILDSSAVIAIIFGEPGYEDLARIIALEDRSRLSAGSLVESSIVAESLAGDRGIRLLDSFLHRSSIIIEPVTEEQALLREGIHHRRPHDGKEGGCFHGRRR